MTQSKPDPLPFRSLLVLIGPLVGAIIMIGADLRPTGSPALDWIWSGLFGATIAWSATRTSAQVWLTMALLGAMAAQTWVDSAVVVAVGAISLRELARFGFSSRPAEPARLSLSSTVVGISIAAFLAQLSDFGVAYLSAIATATVAASLGALAFRTLSPLARRRIITAGAVAGVCVALVGLLTFLGLRDLRGSVVAGEAHARDAGRAMQAGDLSGAVESIRMARRELSNVRTGVNAAPVDLAAALPGAGLNIRAVRRTSDGLDDVLLAAESLIGESDSIEEVFAGGRIDLAQLAAIEVSARQLLDAGASIHGDAAASQSVWLVPALRSQLDELIDRSEPAISAIDELENSGSVVSALLGDDQPRRYLVLFGNPAEARDLGGFTGATALVEIDNGRFSVVRADRPRVLNDSPGTVADLAVPVPQRYLEHRPWMFSQNYSALADFPTLTGALSGLYPVMGGSEIDGVMYLDPSALAAILSMTGPVVVPGVDNPVTADTIEDILTVGQYEMFSKGVFREDFLVQLLDASLTALLDNELQFGNDQWARVAMAIEQDRLLFAPVDPAEFALFDALGTTGRIGELAGQDYLAVSHLNGGPNKLDAYLERSIDYAVELNPHTGELTAEVTVVLKNTAPAGLSHYAADNNHDLDFASNRLTLVVHTPHDAVEWVGGEDGPLTRSYREFDRWRHERVIVIPRGESRTLTLQLAGSLDLEEPYVLDIGHQPLVTTDEVTISLRSTSSPEAAPSTKTLRLRRDLSIELETPGT